MELHVRLTGLMLLTHHGDLQGGRGSAEIYMPQSTCDTASASKVPHVTSLVVNESDVDWSGTTMADQIVGNPAGGDVCIWNLAPGTSIDLPDGGLADKLQAETGRGNGRFPITDTEATSIYWLFNVRPPQNAVFEDDPALTARLGLQSGTLEAQGYLPDPPNNSRYLVYGFATESTSDPKESKALALGLFWKSALLKDAPELTLNGAQMRKVRLHADTKPLHVAISNAPREPCYSGTGRFLDHLVLYELFSISDAEERRVLPVLPAPTYAARSQSRAVSAKPPSLGSGFCPPGSYP